MIKQILYLQYTAIKWQYLTIKNRTFAVFNKLPNTVHTSLVEGYRYIISTD
ncbi:hypothetical protein [Maribacter hydrothermalis]|uniref:hypothetical protein n=1 Tax=Maribacter hydrothermalis TaxID=1836467 RepID=UPI0012F82883|nr:hypothetical protein [Maribacter hydrothermalis]